MRISNFFGSLAAVAYIAYSADATSIGQKQVTSDFA